MKLTPFPLFKRRIMPREARVRSDLLRGLAAQPPWPQQCRW
jgi:hypothetical protein